MGFLVQSVRLQAGQGFTGDVNWPPPPPFWTPSPDRLPVHPFRPSMSDNGEADTGVGLDDDDIWGGDDGMVSDIANKSTAEIRQQRISIEKWVLIYIFSKHRSFWGSTITSWATTATVRDAGSPLPLWWSPFLVVVVEPVSFPSFFSNAGLPFSHHFNFYIHHFFSQWNTCHQIQHQSIGLHQQEKTRNSRRQQIQNQTQ